MTTEQLSILPGIDFISYCRVNNIDENKAMFEIDKDSLYKMWITDYLISNRDRHGMNWGFYYDAHSLKIKGCHPLFDHNNAFDTALMQDKEAPYLFDQTMSMFEAAKIAIKQTDFHFTQDITRKDFMNAEQYESFIERCADLDLHPVLKKNTISVNSILQNEQNSRMKTEKMIDNLEIKWSHNHDKIDNQSQNKNKHKPHNLL